MTTPIGARPLTETDVPLFSARCSLFLPQHPEVYIIILPAFGAISEIIPTFSRKPLFGYPIMILTGIAIGFMGFAVWTHHMFTTGLGPVVNTARASASFISWVLSSRTV